VVSLETSREYPSAQDPKEVAFDCFRFGRETELRASISLIFATLNSRNMERHGANGDVAA
jgi:hypothetical protein